MTDSGATSEYFRSTDDEWVVFDPFLKKRVREVSAGAVDTPTGARGEVAQLNKLFESEGIIGQQVRLDTDIPMIVGSTVTDNGVVNETVVDTELIGREYHQGTFLGCEVLFGSEDPSRPYLLYAVEIEKGSYDRLVVKGLIESSDVLLQEKGTGDADAEKDEDDEIILEAFEILEAVQDEAYQQDVRALQAEFWNTDSDLLQRLKVMGIIATALLASSENDDDREEAIGTIIAYSLEEHMTYAVTGVCAQEIKTESGEEMVSLRAVHGKQFMQRATVRLIDDFELGADDSGDFDIRLTGEFQPAFVFFNIRERIEQTYPLRFLSYIEEEEYDPAVFEKDSYEVAAQRYAPSGGFKTHGEQYREYEAREARIAQKLGDAALEENS